MKRLLCGSILVVLIIFFLAGCVSTEEESSAVEEVPAVAEEPEAEPEPEIITEPEPEVIEEPEEFVVTEEIYQTTFEDIRGIISNLNTIISKKDYNTWLDYLTADYKSYYSRADVLKEFTDLYKQRGYSYRINDLEDYFLYLVVISRANAVLDEIIFIDSNHVKALTELKGKMSVLYYLEKTENGWKIGLKPEN